MVASSAMSELDSINEISTGPRSERKPTPAAPVERDARDVVPTI
ncbi:hypothetical protein J2S58_000569 [Nakamurella flavida]|nr:hypothetical protein [Nakamurella flavida]MDP9776946.1 hypothetical protein [Nakamurella flavida]